MESMTVSKVAVAIMCMVAVLTLSAPLAVEGITCGHVTFQIVPCVNYLRGLGGLPPSCCSGIRGISASATTPVDKQTLCVCIKNVLGHIPDIKIDLAAGLPGKCSVNFPFALVPSTDCSEVQLVQSS